mmetsp:Transcript_36621/g.44762  ORF Transcript_36621/g.44762 Transcript_36621/m.44762 type:complete len:90 (+) Transcript_36621:405-674(+)
MRVVSKIPVTIIAMPVKFRVRLKFAFSYKAVFFSRLKQHSKIKIVSISIEEIRCTARTNKRNTSSQLKPIAILVDVVVFLRDYYNSLNF